MYWTVRIISLQFTHGKLHRSYAEFTQMSIDSKCHDSNSKPVPGNIDITTTLRFLCFCSIKLYSVLELVRKIVKSYC
jgi:hypothetical protein